MTMRTRIGQGLLLCFPLTLLAATLPSRAAHIRPVVKPVPVTAHRNSSHRIAAQAEAPHAAAKSAPPATRKNKSTPAKPNARAGAHLQHPAPKRRSHRLRPEDEADNEPIALVRTHAARPVAPPSTKPAPRPVARATPQEPEGPAFLRAVALPKTSRKAGAATTDPHAATDSSKSDGDKPDASRTMTPKPVTSADFMRAAGATSAQVAAASSAETFDQGVSHPDDDERLPVHHAAVASPASTAPSVSATRSNPPGNPPGSAPSSTPAKPTLPEKVHAAAAHVELVAKADAASTAAALAHRTTASRNKTSLMPEDNDAKLAVIAEAMAPPVSPSIYGRGGRLVVPPALKGTHEILVHQNFMADSEGLSRIQDDEDLNRMRTQHLLVALVSTSSLDVNANLPANRRYARPWAARFVADTARNFYVRFHQPLRLNSAVRTVDYQVRLQRINGNAAGVDGDDASPHLTGEAIDFGKRGMTIAEIAWMRAYLSPLMQAGKLDVEEEFQQACFHISVYRSYAPSTAHDVPGPDRHFAMHPPAQAIHAVAVARADELR